MNTFPEPRIIFGPTKRGQKVNGARGSVRGKTHAQDPFRYVVVHTYESGDSLSIDRMLGAVAAPAKKPARCFQSKNVDGTLLWEGADGKPTSDPSSGIPWTYGGGYMAFTDGRGGFRWTCDPELFVPFAQGGRPNFYGLSICMPGRARQSRLEWQDALSLAHIRGVAKFVVECHRRYGVPLGRVLPPALKAGSRGVCGHGDISVAFKTSTHTDPGPNFPWDILDRFIQEELAMHVQVRNAAGVVDDRWWVARDYTLYRLSAEQEKLAKCAGVSVDHVKDEKDLWSFSNVTPGGVCGVVSPASFRR